MNKSIDIVLTNLDHDLREAQGEAATDLKASKKTAQDLDSIEERLDQVAERLPTCATDSIPIDKSTQDYPDLRLAHRSTVDKQESTSWDKLQYASTRQLRERGIDPEGASIDDLLDEDVLTQIERKYSGEFQLQANLDRYDVIAAAIAGLAAAIVDFLVVRIPGDHVYRGVAEQKGSRLTSWMQSKTDSDKHWIAGFAERLEDENKVSFDAVKKISKRDLVDGFYPKSHRFQTPGHDPLLGLIFGTLDVMRGGLTAISRDGIPALIDGADVGGLRPPVDNALRAFWMTLMHLVSDFPTKMGLPAPGFTMLPMFDIGSFGPNNRTVGELARFMYLKGYDSRHFLTLSTSVAAAEVILRGYYFMRRHFDASYDAEILYAADVAGEKSWRYNKHPRFMGMKVIAHTVGAAANAGKVAFYGGNPLAINYLQWLSFVKDAIRFAGMKTVSPGEVIQGYAYVNARVLHEGWEAIMTDDPNFPELIVHGS